MKTRLFLLSLGLCLITHFSSVEAATPECKGVIEALGDVRHFTITDGSDYPSLTLTPVKNTNGGMMRVTLLKKKESPSKKIVPAAQMLFKFSQRINDISYFDAIRDPEAPRGSPKWEAQLRVTYRDKQPVSEIAILVTDFPPTDGETYITASPDIRK